MAYKDYIIEVHPHQLADDSRWTMTAEHCINFGQIIDGQVPGCTAPLLQTDSARARRLAACPGVFAVRGNAGQIDELDHDAAIAAGGEFRGIA